MAEETTENGAICGAVEALLFACSEPLEAQRIMELLKIEKKQLEEILTVLKERYSSDDQGIELVTVGKKYQLRTKAVFSEYIRELRAGRPRRLSNAALETLAIIAYRQPIVKSDIEKIRGVDATPTLKTLLERGLIRIVGHQATVGQPALYGTADEFLKLFGLESLQQLPTLRDLRELEQDPGEVEESGEENMPEPVEEEVLDDLGQTAEVSG